MGDSHQLGLLYFSFPNEPRQSSHSSQKNTFSLTLWRGPFQYLLEAAVHRRRAGTRASLRSRSAEAVKERGVHCTILSTFM